MSEFEFIGATSRVTQLEKELDRVKRLSSEAAAQAAAERAELAMVVEARGRLIAELSAKLDETHTHRCLYCEQTVTAKTAQRQQEAIDRLLAEARDAAVTAMHANCAHYYDGFNEALEQVADMVDADSKKFGLRAWAGKEFRALKRGKR